MTNKTTYIPLHMHTGYSYLDGGIKASDYANKLKELGIPGGACTDHGNIAGAAKFYKHFTSLDLKPIIGIEAYFCKDLSVRDNKEKFSHQIIIAKNQQGLKNLMKHSSIAYVKYKYKKPLLSLQYFKDLPPEEREGLIITSACLSNHVAQHLIRDEYEAARTVAADFKEVFGDNYYFEVHPNKIDIQPKVNRGIIKLGKELGVKVIAVTDSHYLCDKDSYSHDVLLAIQTNKDLIDENRFRFDGSDFYLQEDALMDKILLSHGLTQEEINTCRKNTWEVYERVGKISGFESKEKFIPSFNCGEQNDFSKFKQFRENNKKYDEKTDYLRFKIFKGLMEKFGDISKVPEKYVEQVNYEISVLQQFNLVDYFLIVADYCQFARSAGILVGYGRGSSAGSLVNYVLGITNIDPIKYNLVFERFLNPGRLATGEFPDIDTDFQHDRRIEVINYLREKYGQSSVAFIGTDTEITPKVAFKDTCRVMKVDFATANKLGKMIPDDCKPEEVKDLPFIKAAVEKSPMMEDVVKHIPFLAGLPKNPGIHASGILISDGPIWNYVPVKDVKKSQKAHEGDMVTQFDMKDCEKAGLVKFDVLGIKNLTVVDTVLKKISDKVDFYNVPFDDEGVFDLISKGQTIGVFQLETSLNTSITKRFQPKNIEDLAVIVSICRPGSLGIVDDYLSVRFGKAKPRYIDERLRPILEETNGYLIYQEQAMEIVKVFAGFNYADADLLRRAIGKKEHETMAKVKAQFLERFDGSKKLGEKIFGFIEASQDYSFNKAHAVSYAVLAYLTAYFKFKYPEVFYSSLIDEFCNNKEKIQSIIEESVDRGIEVRAPNASLGNRVCYPGNGMIYLGFNLVKGFSGKTLKNLVHCMKKSDSILEFFKNTFEFSIDKRRVDALISIGSLDSLDKELNRPQMFDLYNQMYEAKHKMKTRAKVFKRTGELNPAYLEAEGAFNNPVINKIPPLSKKEKKRMEFEYLEITVGNSFLKALEEQIYKFSDEAKLNNCKNNATLKLICEVMARKELKTRATGKPMLAGEINTLTNKLKYVIFSNTYPALNNLFHPGSILLIEGIYQDSDFGKQLIIRRAMEFQA